MSFAVIAWQGFIFFTIFISGKHRFIVTIFWYIWTLLQVFAFPLSLLQFLTILLAYFVSREQEGAISSKNVVNVNNSIKPLISPREAKSNRPHVSLFEQPVIEKTISREWSSQLLNSLEWKRFEDLCSAYFSEINIKNKQTSLGADGGIDIFLYENDQPNATALVQCKSWSEVVGVKLIRELVGVMHHEKILKGYFITTSYFNQAAIEFAKANNMELIDGKSMLAKIKTLTKEAQDRLFLLATSGDFTTPTCVKCGVKMKLRKEGRPDQFWGCVNYPRCRRTLKAKVVSKTSSPFKFWNY